MAEPTLAQKPLPEIKLCYLEVSLFHFSASSVQGRMRRIGAFKLATSLHTGKLQGDFFF